MQFEISRLKPEEVEEAKNMMLEALHENYITDVEIEMNIALDIKTVSEKAGNIIKNQLKNLLNSEKAAVFAARVDGALAGYAIVVVEGDIADFWDLVVKKEYRNIGIGTSLIKDVEKFAKEKGCVAIKLDVNAENENAIKLYEKLGYKKVSFIMMKGDRLNGLP
ncbi:MAG: GNAT family N-acetyltransferase [Nitrososphaeria archaeon]|jgi:ribosomal protein S18 acetylase RimI-like enzyme